MGNNNNCNLCEPVGKENIRQNLTEQLKTEKALSHQPNVTKQYSSKKNHAVAFPSGITYEGQWLGELKHGFGIQKWPDGAQYEGEWSEGKANGDGKFTHADGDIYEGEWKDDKANGYGAYKHSNGA